MSDDTKKSESKKRGRPPVEDPIRTAGIALPGVMLKWLDSESRRTGKSRSEIARWLIRRGVGAESSNDGPLAWTYPSWGQHDLPDPPPDQVEDDE